MCFGRRIITYFLANGVHHELKRSILVPQRSRPRAGTNLILELRLLPHCGGIAVSAFAALGDTLRPKSFAGLFGAAPSIALATLLITLSQKGAPFVAMEGRSMIVGAFALAAYSWTVCVLLKKLMLPSWTATMAALIVWFAVALGVSATLFQLS